MGSSTGSLPVDNMTAPLIVVIEDNPNDIQLLRFALDEQDVEYYLRVLQDGTEALAFIHEQRTIPDSPSPCVIVLDLHLPKHEGVAVLEAIRKTPALEDVRVVVLTGFAAPLEQAQVKDLGVRLYREKPIDLNEFIDMAQEIIDICTEGGLSTRSTS